MHLARNEEVSPRDGAADPFAAAWRGLFPGLRHRELKDAAAALAENRADAAQAILQRHLEKSPRDAAALNLMAELARQSGAFEEAERLLLLCLQEEPDCAGYRFHYAITVTALKKYEEALAAVDAVLKKEPGNPAVRDWKAKVLSHLERFAEALAYRRELTDEYPQVGTLWISYGNLLRHLGKQEDAVQAYRKASESGEASIAAYMRLADLKTYRFSEAETARMQALSARLDIPAEERANLWFALGAAYGDQKRYAEAFNSCAKANALLRVGTEFDADGLATHRMNCERMLTKDFFRERSGWGNPSRAPIFIVGMPRSGSTLIEQMLSSHSAIEGLGELAELDRTVGRRLALREGGQPEEYRIGGWFEFHGEFVRALSRAMCEWNAEECHAMGEEYLAAAGNGKTSKRPFFTDKGLQNFGYIGLIHLILPNAKIVDARRHPLDCGWSCFKSRFPAGQPFAHRLSDIGKHYANYAKLMAHFDGVLPGRVHRVLYEDLVANPEMELRRLFDHLELPFEDACLRFHENQRAANTVSSTQVRLPLYKTGMEQWRPYEPWLGPLKAALGDVLERYPAPPGSCSLSAA
ncbi:MAG: sulfotransferase [Alphaproteobacteria bacterium]|nr:sulfotransferase [Alphaproteobacteria bacterium]